MTNDATPGPDSPAALFWPVFIVLLLATPVAAADTGPVIRPNAENATAHPA